MSKVNEINNTSRLHINVIGGGVYLKNKPQNITITWEIKDDSGNRVIPDMLFVNNIKQDPTLTSKTFNRVFSDVDFTVRAVKGDIVAIGTTTARFVGPTQTVENSLDSYSHSTALSANQGRILDNKIENATNRFKGLFLSVEDLSKKFKNGVDGDWAIVGESIPAPIFIWNKNQWEASGGNYDGETVDLTAYSKKQQIAEYTDDYNVSKNHQHSVKVYDDINWSTVKYDKHAPVFRLGDSYDSGEIVNMVNDEAFSYKALNSTNTAPYLTQKMNSFTLEEAISFLPEDLRVSGQKISFYSSEKEAWMTYVFTGGDYTNPTYWEIFTNNIDPDTDKHVAELYDITDELDQHLSAVEDNLNSHITESNNKFDEIDQTLEDHSDRMDDIEDEILMSSVEAACSPKDVEILADRAYKDHTGKIIADEYVTRNNLTNEIIDITNQQVTDLKPGSVDPEDLSEATKQLLGNKNITNLPDEEDITVDENNLLKFKDKEYSPKDYSGMGRKVLRKHYVNGVNTLTQHMINKPNTIYIIQYDYCLADQTIEIPENCVLQFEGGSLRNGTIIFNDTYVEYKKNILINVLTEGKLKNSQLNLSVFNINNNDYSNCIQTLVNSCNKVILDIDNIQVKEVEINKSIEIDGFNNTIKLISINGEESNYYNVFYSTTEDIDICIKNIKIIGSFEDNINIESNYDKAIIQFENSKNTTIENCTFKGIISKQVKGSLYGNIITVINSYSTEIKNSYFENNGGYENIALSNVNNKKSTTFIISNNTFKDYNNGFSVFNCWAGNKGNVIFENNKLINCFYYGSLLNIYGETLYIANNTIIDCMSSSVFDFTEDGSWVSKNIVFKNNTIKLLEEAEVYNYSTLSKETVSGGIGIKIESESFEITNNIIEAQVCIQILHAVKYFDNEEGYFYSGNFSPNKICNIYNNILNYSKFKNNKNVVSFASGVYASTSNPLLSDTIININIHDNNFYSGYSFQDENKKSFRQLPIFIYSAKNIRINNNVFEDCIGINRSSYGNLIEIQSYIYDKEYTDEKLVKFYQIDLLEINNNIINLNKQLSRYYLIYFYSRNFSKYNPNFVNVLKTNICNNVSDTSFLLLQGSKENWFNCILNSLTIKNNNEYFINALYVSYPNIFNVDTDNNLGDIKLPFIKRGQFYDNDYLALSNGIISYNKYEAGSLEQSDVLSCDNGYFMALQSGEILDTNLPECSNIGIDVVFKDNMYFLYLGKSPSHLLPINVLDVVSSYNNSIKEPKKTVRGALKYDTDSRQVYIDLSTNNNSQQLNFEGKTIGLTKGDTESRPNNLTLSYDIGYKYYDTSLNKPIWWDGKKWVDATGAQV